MTVHLTAAPRGAAAPCPLCAAAAGDVLDEVRCDDLERLYVSLLGDAAREEFASVRGGSLELVRCRACDLRFFAPALVGSARLYAALQRFPWYYLDEKREYAFASRHVPRGAAVLEVGCGAAAFARLLPDARYVGLELSPSAASRAAARGADVRVQTLRAHVDRSGGYDAVAAFQVLEHVADPGGFLLDARRALAAGGRLILSVPAEDSYLNLGQNYALNLPPHHQTRWTHEAMRSIARLHGLRVVALEHEPLADIHVPDYALVRCDAALTLGRRPLVDLSRRALVRRATAAALARVVAPLVRRARPRPPGHSLTVVYEVG